LIIAAVVVVAVGAIGVRLLTGRTEVAEADAARRALVGLAVRDVTAADADAAPGAGVVVSAVQANGLAAAAGLRAGDLVTAVNGGSTGTVAAYQAALDADLGATAVAFSVRRGGAVVEMRLAPDLAAMFNSLGIAYVKDGRQAEAKAAFAKAIQLDPAFAEAYYNRANVLAADGDVAGATVAFAAAVEHNDDFREARYRLAEMHAEAGSLDEALAQLKRAAALDPDTTADRDLRPVETVQPTRGTIQRDVLTSGAIEAAADVQVHAKAPGRILETFAEEGDRVDADQVVMVLEHDALELQVVQTQAAVLAAAAAHEQAQSLAEVRIRAQAAQAAAGVSAAEAALKLVRDLSETQAQSQIEQAEAGLAAIQANLDKLRRGLRDEERAQIQASLTQATAASADADRNADRMRTLFANGAVSRHTLDGAETQLEVAQAQQSAAREQWAMAQSGSRPEDILAVEAQVRQAEASVAVARKQSESQTWESDIAMAEAQVEQARASNSSAQSLVEAESWAAEITGALAALTQAEAARSLAEKRLDDAFVKAPIAGVVARRRADPGDMANPAAPLFDIVDMTTVRATVRVLEADLGALQVGGPAAVSVQALDAPVAARISRISPTVDPVSRTADLEIEIANPSGAVLPGMFARVALPVDVREDAILIPRDTVVADAAGGGQYVYTVDRGRARRSPISAGLTQGATVQVVSGIDDDEEVVFSGRQSLREGDFVKVVRRVSAW